MPIKIGIKELSARYIGAKEVQKVYIGNNLVYSKNVSPLPPEYYLLDYIEGTDNSYFAVNISRLRDRLITYNATFKRLFSARAVQNDCIIAATGAQNNYFDLIIPTEGKSRFPSIVITYTRGTYYNLGGVGYTDNENWMTVSLSRQNGQYGFYLLGSDAGIPLSENKWTYSSNDKMGVFNKWEWGIWSNNKMVPPGIMVKHIDFGYYSGGSVVLLYDFYPAKRKNDGAVGFYDLVSGMFYSSETNTPFTAGPIIG